MEYTPVPHLFVTAVLPHLDDPVELRVLLVSFFLLSKKRRPPRTVSVGELIASTVEQGAALGRPELLTALRQACSRGVLLELGVQDRSGNEELLYLLNTERNRRAVAAI